MLYSFKTKHWHAPPAFINSLRSTSATENPRFFNSLFVTGHSGGVITVFPKQIELQTNLLASFSGTAIRLISDFILSWVSFVKPPGNHRARLGVKRAKQVSMW